MATRRLVNSRTAQCGADRFLHAALVHVVTPPFAGARIEARRFSREYILPSPLRFCIRILASQSVGEKHGLDTLRSVALERSLAIGEMPLEGNDQLVRERHHAILGALAIPDQDRPMLEVQILDAQTNAFQEPQPRAVLQAGDQPIDPLQRPQDAPDFGGREHYRQPLWLLGAYDARILAEGAVH